MEEINKYIVNHNSNIKTAIKQIDIGGIGFTLVVDDDNKVIGVISDGDFRRAVLDGINLNDNVLRITNKNFKYIKHECSDQEALNYLKKYNVEFLPIIINGKLLDIITYDSLKSKETYIKHYNQIDLPVVIMAGGRGIRMDPFTRILPKPLIPIGEKTMIEIIMDNYKKYGMKNFYISINYKGKMIKTYFEEHKDDYNIRYIEEVKELGTAGALNYLNDKIQTDFFVSNCDIIIKDDYSKIYKFHKKNKFALTIVTSLQHIPIPYGVCKMENGGILKEITEKPEYDIFINTGMYILTPGVLKYITKNEFLQITDLINELQKRNFKIGAYPVSEKSYVDIGQWKDYKDVIKMLQL